LPPIFLRKTNRTTAETRIDGRQRRPLKGTLDESALSQTEPRGWSVTGQLLNRFGTGIELKLDNLNRGATTWQKSCRRDYD
jgi:hypothetical protein